MKRNVSSNAVLNIIKQSCNIIFPLITYPYVARVLGKRSLGKFSFADSVVSYFMIFALLGTSTYAVREGARIRDEKETFTTFCSELFSINLITTVLAYSLLMIFVFTQQKLQRNSVLIFILSINIITSTLSRDWINNIYEDFFYITVRYVVFQLISLVLTFFFIHGENDYVVYTGIMMFSNSGAYLSSFFYTIKKVPVRFTLKMNLKRHLGPILFLFCSTLAIQIYVKSDITVLGYLRSDAEVGIYAAVSKIYTIIKSLLNAIIMVAIPRLSYYLSNGSPKDYNYLLIKLRDSLIVFMAPCIVGVFCLSKEITYLIGGKSYASGYFPLSILCFSLFFAVMGCYYAQGVLVANRDEKIFMIITLISAMVNVGLNIILVPFFGMSGAATTTVVAEALICITCGIRSRKYCKIKCFKEIVPIILGCVFIAVNCILFKQFIGNILVRLFLSIITSIVIYFVILIIGRNSLVINMLYSLKRKFI